MRVPLMSWTMIALIGSTPALAFDSVNWNWDADVTSTVNTDAVSQINVSPAGIQQVETSQNALGSMSAISANTAISSPLTGLLGLTSGDLVGVSTVATAVGNSASLDSDVSMAFDAYQAFSGVGATLAVPLTGTIADITLPGTILASATTTTVLNGTVDSQATGVGNNLVANLETTSDQDSFLLGNVVQTSAAIVTTDSTVSGVTYSPMTGLGSLTDPAVSSSATSVGNNIGVTLNGIN